MKKQLLHIVTAVTLLSFPSAIFAQAPNLGTAADFVLFSTTLSISYYLLPFISVFNEVTATTAVTEGEYCDVDGKNC